MGNPIFPAAQTKKNQVQAGLAIDWNCGVMLSQSQFSSVLLEIFTVFLHACNASIRLRNKA